jgi:hypothetical protein
LASNRASDGRFKRGAHWRAHAVFRERQYLVCEYVDRGRSASDIAAEHGVTENAIYHWLTRHQVPRRSIAEARARKHWGAIGAANPMFGKTGPANPSYVDGSSPERQRAYARGEGKAFLRSVLARDSYACRRCGGGKKSPRGFAVHHIKSWADNAALRFDMENVVTLCRVCHEWVHSRANVAREFIA